MFICSIQTTCKIDVQGKASPFNIITIKKGGNDQKLKNYISTPLSFPLQIKGNGQITIPLGWI